MQRQALAPLYFMLLSAGLHAILLGLILFLPPGMGSLALDGFGNQDRFVQILIEDVEPEPEPEAEVDEGDEEQEEELEEGEEGRAGDEREEDEPTAGWRSRATSAPTRTSSWPERSRTRLSRSAARRC